MMRRPRPYAVAAMAACAAAATWLSARPLQAAPLSVTNAGFEDPDVGDGAFTDQSVPGWVGTSEFYGVFDPNESVYPGTAGDNPVQGGEGDQIAYLVPFNSVVTLTQTLSDTLQADTTYTLTAAVGTRLASHGRPSAGYRLDLLAGNTVIASEQDAVTLPEGSMIDRTVSYSSLAADDPYLGLPLGIRISTTFAYPPGANELRSTDVDNVRLDAAPVPEPTAAALLLAAGGGWYGLGRRRRRGA